MSASPRRARRASIILAGCAAALAGTASGESLLQFDLWMQRLDRGSQSVQRNLARGDARAASVDARELLQLYQSMERFFAERGQSDSAVTLSREGAELAGEVVRSIAVGDLSRASHQAIAIAQACRDCHEEYKPLDS